MISPPRIVCINVKKSKDMYLVNIYYSDNTSDDQYWTFQEVVNYYNNRNLKLPGHI